MQNLAGGRRTSSWSVLALNALCVVAADVVSKLVVTSYFDDRELSDRVTVLPSLIHLEHTENMGISFGLLDRGGSLVWVLVVAGLAVIALVAWRLLPGSGASYAVALGMIAGGGVANAIDRLDDGRVTDFIDIWRWPAFNLADASITIGVVALALLLMLRPVPEAVAQNES